jgi:hypothetical protein
MTVFQGFAASCGGMLDCDLHTQHHYPSEFLPLQVWQNPINGFERAPTWQGTFPNELQPTEGGPKTVWQNPQ